MHRAYHARMIVCYTHSVHFTHALFMKTQTRTKTTTATQVALYVSLGAAAAFAAVSLNGAFTPNTNFTPTIKSGPPYTREMCQNDCSKSYDMCRSAMGGSKCDDRYYQCLSNCNAYPSEVPIPGYMTPGATTPGYEPVTPEPTSTHAGGPTMGAPGYEPAGNDPAPGYLIPPTKKRLPPWAANDNPPDPKLLKKFSK